jgi:putative transposase
VTDSRASHGATTARFSERSAVEHRRVHATARLNNRVEPSHEPTRLREYVMRRFTSVPATQRFLVAFRGFCNQFRPRRHLLTAAEYRTVPRARDCGWRELAGAAV